MECCCFTRQEVFAICIATGETILLPGAHDALMARILQRLGSRRSPWAAG